MTTTAATRSAIRKARRRAAASAGPASLGMTSSTRPLMVGSPARLAGTNGVAGTANRKRIPVVACQ